MSGKLLFARFLLLTSAVVLLGGLIWFTGARALFTDPAPSPSIPLVFSPDPTGETLAVEEEAAASESPTPPPPRPVASSPPTRVVVERVGVDAPVITLGLDRRNIPEVPDDIWARNTGGASARTVVAWYAFSHMPGQRGNAVFGGHVTWEKQPAVFWDIARLAEGDIIRIRTEAGDDLQYQVTANLLVDPKDPDSVRYLFSTGEDMVTLITCGGTFQADPSLPFGGDYTDRVIVQAKRVHGDATAGPAGQPATSQRAARRSPACGHRARTSALDFSKKRRIRQSRLGLV
ncbi:MAG: sortase [Chloroflexi bacterium]|nr:sortase [Chloroflexota bacterium]